MSLVVSTTKEKGQRQRQRHTYSTSEDLNGVVETLIDTPFISTKVRHIERQDKTRQTYIIITNCS